MGKRRKIVYALPLFIVLIVPFTVYGRLVDAGLSDFAWFSSREKAFDFFLYEKRNIILLASCLILIFGAVMLWKKDFKGNIRKMLCIFWPFGIYVGFVIFSSVCSPYQSYAWTGMLEQYESAFVVVGYFLICVYAYMACCQEIFAAFGIFCCAIGGIGTLQLFGIDLYRSEFLQKLLVSGGLEKIKYTITVETGRSYCSLSNPNYVGMLCCLAIPVLVMLAVCAKTKRKKRLYGASVVLMFLSLLGSRSKSGIAVCALCMVLMAVLFRKAISERLRLRQQKVDVAIACVMLMLCVVVCLLVYRWGELWGYDDRPDTRISEIATTDENVKIIYRGKELFFNVDYESASLAEAICVVDENGHAYEVYEEEGVLHFEEKKLSRLTVALAQYGEYTALELWDGSFYWYFSNQNGTWCYLTRYGKPDKLDSSVIPVWKPLEGKERIVSGRGYIWSRTIPLIKETMLLGSGQDSFAVVFPNPRETHE